MSELDQEIIVCFPTNNVGKYKRYEESFKRMGIKYYRYYNDEKGNPPNEGSNLAENAKAKAEYYYNLYSQLMPDKRIIIMSTDEALYFDEEVLTEKNNNRKKDGRTEIEQPGPFVRRFDGLNGTSASDDEVVEKYTSIVTELGGEVEARWNYALAVFDGQKFRQVEWKEPVLFSDSPHYPITPGYVLNNITIVGKRYNPLDGKYSNIMLSDLSEEARFEYLRKYTDSVAEFVTSPELEELPSSTPNKSIEKPKETKPKKRFNPNDSLIIGTYLNGENIVYSDLSDTAKQEYSKSQNINSSCCKSNNHTKPTEIIP